MTAHKMVKEHTAIMGRIQPIVLCLDVSPKILHLLSSIFDKIDCACITAVRGCADILNNAIVFMGVAAKRLDGGGRRIPAAGT